MKKVVTMIGTSILENYLKKDHDVTFSNNIEALKSKSSDKFDEEKYRISYMKGKLNSWIRSISDSTKLLDTCAEIKSVVKIAEEVKEDLELYFLTSDTILSNLIFEVILENWERFPKVGEFKVHPENRRSATIKGLQTEDRKKFTNEGMPSLIQALFRISGDYWNDVIINVTSGYKATIPYLTIFGQVFKSPIYYIFENTDSLIKIPYVPININEKVFEENEKFLFDLEVCDTKLIPSNTPFKDEIESLIERVDNLVSLNPIGLVLWERYRSSFYLFQISEILSEELEKLNVDERMVAEKSFMELERRLRENPADPDLDHKLSNLKFPENFKTFKHKESNLQVRILYKKQDYKNRYGFDKFLIYLGLIAIGNDVHDSDDKSKYIEYFENNIYRVTDLDKYLVYRIPK